MTTAISGSTTAPISLEYAGALTPDSLLLYCQTRIRGIDDQIHAQYARQQKYRETSSAVNTLQQLFQDASKTAQGINPNDEANGVKNVKDYQAQIEAQFKVALESCPPGSAEYKKIAQAKKDYESACADGHCDAGECGVLGEAFNKAGQELGSSAELEMISLNSLMSQRQTAVQLTTNLISALGETRKSIAAKMGQ